MMMKRLTYLFHHWLGIGMCLLMAMWFFSGIVMMYVPYPSFTQTERLNSLPELQPQVINFSPEKLLSTLSAEQQLQSLSLSSIQNRPAYLMSNNRRQVSGMFADTGEMLPTFTQQEALASAEIFAQSLQTDSKNKHYQGKVDKDQWTLSAILNTHRPLHHIKLNDKKHTELYISSTTGQVVLKTTRTERIANWLGSNIHWIYFTPIRKNAKLWYWIIVVASIVGLLSIFTGALVGWWRIRIKKRYKNKRMTPYTGQMKLHHIMGLLFLIPITTYTYSGLMSMGSFGVPKDKSNYFEQLKAYQGEKRLSTFSQSADNIQQLINDYPNARELVWYWIDGEEHYYLLDQNNQRLLTDGKTQQQRQEKAVSLLQDILPEHNYQTELLEQYDRYYYAHHQRQPSLPALRVKFDDDDKSWFYIDLTTGELSSRQTKNSRTMRWLYKGLHSLDFPFLINNRPLWDVVVITLNLLGFIFSVSAIIIAWRYLRDPKKRKIKLFKKRRRSVERKP